MFWFLERWLSEWANEKDYKNPPDPLNSIADCSSFVTWLKDKLKIKFISWTKSNDKWKANIETWKK